MGPSRAKSLEKDTKMKARGRFLEHFGLRLTASGGSEPPWGRFGRHPGVCKFKFVAYFLEKRVLYNSMPVCGGSVTFASPGAQVGATWAKQSGPNAPKVASQRDQGSKVCLVGSVLLASYGTNRNSAIVLSKVKVI